jgi:ATP-dependent DNA ligase
VIIGYQPSLKGRAFASLMLANRENGKLVYRGNVGTGFNDKTLASLSEKLGKIGRAKPALIVPREAARGAKWVEPQLVAQIKFANFTGEGAVRHAVFLGLRGDKAAKDVQSRTSGAFDANARPANASRESAVSGLWRHESRTSGVSRPGRRSHGQRTCLAGR